MKLRFSPGLVVVCWSPADSRLYTAKSFLSPFRVLSAAWKCASSCRQSPHVLCCDKNYLQSPVGSGDVRLLCLCLISGERSDLGYLRVVSWERRSHHESPHEKIAELVVLLPTTSPCNIKSRRQAHNYNPTESSIVKNQY